MVAQPALATTLSGAAVASVLALAIALHPESPPTASQAAARGAQNPALRTGLSAREQLVAMQAGINAAPTFFDGYTPDPPSQPTYHSNCPAVVATLANSPGDVLAGNYRGTDGGCYVWLNLAHSSLLTGQEICKLALHESGHLGGLWHSQNPDDVMYAPFRSDPVPAPCVAPLPRPRRAAVRQQS